MPALANGSEELEGEEDGDGERLRRRRGRRGGRRRVRREDTLAAVSEIGHPAAESIEIVAIDSNQSDESGFASGELAAAAPTTEDTPFLVPESSHAEIETASLPALAGETFPPPAVELAPASPETVTLGDERREPDASPWEEPGNDRENPPPEAFGSVISAGSEEANRSNEQHSMPLPVTPGQEPAHETQFPSGQSAPPSESEPTEIVQEVTKKPENPRRGWWQRLIQS